MKKCKNCDGDLLFKIRGLKDFCSIECQSEHRRNYKTNYMRTKRNSYIDDDVDITGKGKVAIPLNVDTTSAYKQTVFNGQKRGSVTFDSYGGEKWYRLAKKECCNFKDREEEGYCITLTSPIQTFKKQCDKCGLGNELMKRTI